MSGDFSTASLQVHTYLAGSYGYLDARRWGEHDRRGAGAFPTVLAVDVVTDVLVVDVLEAGIDIDRRNEAARDVVEEQLVDGHCALQVCLLVDRERQLTLGDQVKHGNADVKGRAADPLRREAQLLDRRRDGDPVAATAREHELDVLVPLVPGLDGGERRPFGGADRDLDE